MANTQGKSEKARLQNEKKRLKEDRARQKKEAKKRAREIARQEEEMAEEGDSGGFFTFFATVGIVIVWLAIICVVIKLDVGGFGSGVLTPLLKDVPVVSWVLPTPKAPTLDSTDNNPEGYTMTEALERISQLELELEQAKGGNLSRDEEIAELAIAKVEDFIQNVMGLPKNLRSMGVKEEDIPYMASVFSQPGKIEYQSEAFVPISVEGAIEIYKMAY